MSEEAKQERSSSRLERAHLVVTIGVAVLGGFISWQQLRLTEEQQRIASWVDRQEQELKSRRTLTEQSAVLLTHAKEYLDAIDMAAEKKKRVLISLLQIEKELRVSRTGELTDTAVNALPYHIALLAGDSEALAHIGATEADLALWIPIAKTSGDIEVRRAAIGALKNVALLTSDASALETCVSSIIDLTKRWNVGELRDQAIEAMTRIAEAWQTDSAGSEQVNTLLAEALAELQGTVGTAAPPVKLAGGGYLSPDPSADRDAAAQQEARVAKQAQALAEIRGLRQFYEQSGMGRSVDAATLDALLAGLSSDDAKERRVARSRISDYGKRAIPVLLRLLESNPKEYRVRIGVIGALTLMEQPVPIEPDQAGPLVQLLGDPDPTVRENAAVFFGNLTDPDAVEAVRRSLESLSASPENLDNGNLIYNSVVVLGDWLRYGQEIAADARQRIQASLRKIDARLASDAGRGWESTRGRIGAYLELSSRGGPPSVGTVRGSLQRRVS